jgi:hypothetical protein
VKTGAKVLLGSLTALPIAAYVVGCHTGLGAYDLPQYWRDYGRIMAESERLGFPTTAASLTGPRVPEAENARPAVAAPCEAIGAVVPADASTDPARRFSEAAESAGPTLDKIAAELRRKPGWQTSYDYDYGTPRAVPRACAHEVGGQGTCGPG